jgi:hypothetical protein
VLSLSRDLAQRWDRLLTITHNAETPDLLGQGICVSAGSIFVTATLESSDHKRGIVLKLGPDGSLLNSNVLSAPVGLGDWDLGHCCGDGLGGFWCSGIIDDGNGGTDSLLSFFNFNLFPQATHQFGAFGPADDSENCGPAIGGAGEVYHGGYFSQHSVVVNDVVLSGDAVDSMNWQDNGAQDIDNLAGGAFTEPSVVEDFSFSDADNGGGFVLRYQP